ncbi:hypothetical protein BV898_06005 [Hypsibius exemplaris]|uniref:Uncharacterized protein n=1 Tax=Hypsibius exemplaris TaxID=2072580 RepID=A0A1W0WXR5_HYPEX|nr:hypothetical protein BV898_06005 [Hypsibius exemplaris]
MQRADPVSAPHEGCTFYPESYEGFNNGSHYVPTTLCTQSQEFVLPDTFNVSLVNADTEALWFRFTTVIVKDNYNPFPNLPHLRHFIMDLFYSDANPRFPLNGILIHNKNHITHLDLTRVNMSGINRADFNGFVRLNSLRLDRCQITAIGKDIFEEIGTIVDAPSLSGIYPQLEIFIISDNIEQLDWAFLSPISRSLKILDLNKINLRNLTSTADSNNPVFLESIRKLDMSNNMVSTLPRFLYESLNLISLNEFDFTSYHQEQQFCENYVGCKCCELYNFTMCVRWAVQTRVRSNGPTNPRSNNCDACSDHAHHSSNHVNRTISSN